MANNIRPPARSNQLPQGRYNIGGKTESLPTRLGWWDRKIMSKSSTDVSITITPRYATRPDLLAYDLYGSASLMWVVLQFNSIIDINEEFKVGSEITVPSKSRLFTQILTNR